jgi:hypothetical protein
MSCCNNTKSNQEGMLIVNKAREAAMCAEANCASSFTNATNAATSATNAANSETAAATSETNVENIWEDFQERYMGSYPSAPTATGEGAMYWNSTSNALYIWNGSSWVLLPTGFDEFTNFLATGTTNARNLVTRTADVANVLDFGADHTGVADSSTAFQNALTSLQNSVGGKLFIPPGKYIFNSRVTFTNRNIFIEGSGIEVTQLISNNSNGIFYLNLTGLVNPYPNAMEWACHFANFTMYPNVNRVPGNWGGSGTAIRIDRPERELAHQTYNQSFRNISIRLKDTVTWPTPTSPQFDCALYLKNPSQTTIDSCFIDGPGCHESTAIRVEGPLNVGGSGASKVDSLYAFRITNTDIAGWKISVHQTGWIESVYIANSFIGTAYDDVLLLDGSGTTLNGNPGTYNGHFEIRGCHMNAQNRCITIKNAKHFHISDNNLYLQPRNNTTRDASILRIEPGVTNQGETYLINNNFFNTAIISDNSSKTNIDAIVVDQISSSKNYIISNNCFNTYGGGPYASNNRHIRFFGNHNDVQIANNVFYCPTNTGFNSLFFQNSGTPNITNQIISGNIWYGAYYTILLVDNGTCQVNGGNIASVNPGVGATKILNIGSSPGVIVVNGLLNYP